MQTNIYQFMFMFFAEYESKFELEYENGLLKEINIKKVKGRESLADGTKITRRVASGYFEYNGEGGLHRLFMEKKEMNPYQV